MSLRPCTGCARHVRHHEAACPFCGTASSTVAGRGAIALPRAGRAAIMAFGATLATASVGCPDDTMMGGMDAAYGGPPSDAAITDDADEHDSDAGLDAAIRDDASPSDDADLGATDANEGPRVDAPPEEDAGGAVPPYGTPSP